MRRTGRYQRKKQKKIIIVSALSLLLLLTVGYAAFSTNLSITAKGNVKEKSRIIQAWEENSQTDFHSDFYKQNIVSATFLDNADIPSNATESWNVSEDKKHGGVMAWVVPNTEDSTKYDLYIGAKNGVIANEDSSNLFYKFIDVEAINFNNNFDTSMTTKMANMFRDCSNLLVLDLNSFDTKNVIDMWRMFQGCILLEEIELKNFDTKNVISMNGMFAQCQNITHLDLSSFYTPKVTNMGGMFNGCWSLSEIDISNFDTSNVTDMESMFYATKVINLNLCSFNTKNAINMKYMFRYTTELKNIYVGPNWSTSQADTTDMFYGSGVSSVTTGQC